MWSAWRIINHIRLLVTHFPWDLSTQFSPSANKTLIDDCKPNDMSLLQLHRWIYPIKLRSLFFMESSHAQQFFHWNHSVASTSFKVLTAFEAEKLLRVVTRFIPDWNIGSVIDWLCLEILRFSTKIEVFQLKLLKPKLGIYICGRYNKYKDLMQNNLHSVSEWFDR